MNSNNNNLVKRRKGNGAMNVNLNGVQNMFQQMMHSYNMRNAHEAQRRLRAQGRDNMPQNSARRKTSSEAQQQRNAAQRRRYEAEAAWQRSRARGRNTNNLRRANRPQENNVMNTEFNRTVRFRTQRCAICLSALATRDTRACSRGHRYHQNCMNRWMSEQLRSGHNGSCPSCRNVIIPH